MQRFEVQVEWFKRDLRIIDQKPLFKTSKTLKSILTISLSKMNFGYNLFQLI